MSNPFIKKFSDYITLTLLIFQSIYKDINVDLLIFN